MIGERLGDGRRAAVFAYGEHAIKLYEPPAGKTWAFLEAAHLAALEASGLPVPHVHGAGFYGGRWGLVMDRVAGPSFGRLLEDVSTRQAHITEMARLHRRLHAASAASFPSLKARLRRNILTAQAIIGPMSAAILERLDGLPDGDRLCHGDFHPFNILGEIGEAIVVDWLDVAIGDPTADVARSFALIHHVSSDVASAYLDAYAAEAGMPRSTFERWLPVVAAARIAENVPAETAGLLALVHQGLSAA